MNTVLIEGRLDEPFAEATVDRSGLRLLNVALLGRESLNGRVYSDKALADAARLYEGARIFLDHPTRSQQKESRSVRDLVGKVVAARVAEGKVRGDVHLLDTTEGRRVLALAEQMPDLVGMSHRAQGKVTRRNGQDVVEEISSVASVDLVTEPASVGGLHESHDRRQGYDADRDLAECHRRLFGAGRPAPEVDLEEVHRRLFGRRP